MKWKFFILFVLSLKGDDSVDIERVCEVYSFIDGIGSISFNVSSSLYPVCCPEIRRFVKSAVWTAQRWKLPPKFRWLEGHRGVSCTDVCNIEGESCAEEVLSIPLSHDLINSSAMEAGFFCEAWTVGPLAGFTSTFSRNSAFVMTNNSQSILFRAMCTFEDSQLQNDLLKQSATLLGEPESRTDPRRLWCMSRREDLARFCPCHVDPRLSIQGAITRIEWRGCTAALLKYDSTVAQALAAPQPPAAETPSVAAAAAAQEGLLEQDLRSEAGPPPAEPDVTEAAEAARSKGHGGNDGDDGVGGGQGAGVADGGRPARADFCLSVWLPHTPSILPGVRRLYPLDGWGDCGPCAGRGASGEGLVHSGRPSGLNHADRIMSMGCAWALVWIFPGAPLGPGCAHGPRRALAARPGPLFSPLGSSCG